MNPKDGIRQAWQASGADAAPAPAFDQVRGGADLFHRRIRRRNAIEYAAGIFVLLVFSAYAWWLPSPAARAGAMLIVIGNFVVAWQLRRRASAVPPPEAEAGAQPILVHQRAQLARQRDALASIFTWYLLPFVPGLAVMMFAPAFDRGPSALATLSWAGWMSIAVVAAVFGLIWWLNRRAAARMQAQIEAIDALLDEGR
jgi:hypothetical protein